MTDLIEKVARDMFELAEKAHDGGGYVGSYRFPCGEGTYSCLDGKFDMHVFSKAAIETVLQEMMKPTSEMIQAGATVDNHKCWPSSVDVLQAMLHAFAQQHNIKLGGEDAN